MPQPLRVLRKTAPRRLPASARKHGPLEPLWRLLLPVEGEPPLLSAWKIKLALGVPLLFCAAMSARTGDVYGASFAIGCAFFFMFMLGCVTPAGAAGPAAACVQGGCVSFQPSLPAPHSHPGCS